MAANRRWGRLCAAVAGAAALHGVYPLDVAAQTVTSIEQLPPSAVPNQFSPPTQIEAPTLLEFDVSVETPAGVRPPPEIADEVITVTQIRVEGMTVFAREDVLPFFEPVIGEDITFARLYDVAGEVTALYREKGYALSFTFFPPQVVDDGIYTLQVVEGFVDTVEVRGVDGWIANWLEQEAQAIRWVRPFRLNQLDQLVRRVNGLSGATVEAILQPSEDRERASKVVLDVDYKILSFDAVADNRASNFVGPWKYSGGFTHRNTYGGEMDLRTIVASSLEEQQTITAQYTQFIGDPSLQVRLIASYSKTEPGDTLKDTNIVNVTRNAEILGKKVFLLDESKQFILGAGLGFIDAQTFNNDRPEDVQDLNIDRIWRGNIGVSYIDEDLFSGRGQFESTLTLRQGLPNWPGATEGAADADDPNAIPSRIDARPENTTARLSLKYLQPLSFFDPRLSLQLEGLAQWNRKGSFASDEFSIGGTEFGRGYDPSEIAGDAGYATSVELAYFIPEQDWLKLSLRPYVFWDFGYVYNYNQLLGGKSTLASAGLGMYMFSSDLGATFNMEFAQPLTRRVASAPVQSGGKPFRVYFSATFQHDEVAETFSDLYNDVFR